MGGGQAPSGAQVSRQPAPCSFVKTSTAGAQPSGWDNFVGWVKNGVNPSGQVSALVDDTRARIGSKSMPF